MSMFSFTPFLNWVTNPFHSVSAQQKEKKWWFATARRGRRRDLPRPIRVNAAAGPPPPARYLAQPPPAGGPPADRAHGWGWRRRPHHSCCRTAARCCGLFSCERALSLVHRSGAKGEQRRRERRAVAAHQNPAALPRALCLSLPRRGVVPAAAAASPGRRLLARAAALAARVGARPLRPGRHQVGPVGLHPVRPV